MSKHASRPYNPSIANVYYLSGLIESWGRGIEKICQSCEEDGSPLPEYTIHPSDIMIQFIAAEDRIVRTSLYKVTEGVTEKVTEKVTEAEQKLLSLLLKDPAYTYAPFSIMLQIPEIYKNIVAHLLGYYHLWFIPFLTCFILFQIRKTVSYPDSTFRVHVPATFVLINPKL